MISYITIEGTTAKKSGKADAIKAELAGIKSKKLAVARELAAKAFATHGIEAAIAIAAPFDLDHSDFPALIADVCGVSEFDALMSIIDVCRRLPNLDAIEGVKR